ncbi:MAG: 3-oxoacyl-ACP synthase [Crocinitomicaceae bacterium]|nr:3-oxoacyl-ACP synthase [Crocinitomicaceae bacterium]|tara:strand:- start:3830 stop:4831 length:1002 start_codon:yes stop_codon:yes gene_type:complete
MAKVTAAITAIGGYVPETKVTNKDLEKLVDTSDEWITTRTGIKERRIEKREGAGASDIAVPAVLELCEKRGISPEEIELLICATVTADYNFPSAANIIADKVGAKNAWSYDVNAACSGFIYALSTGAQFIETGRYKKVVIVGVDKMSSILNYNDRTTCVIFGDGGGAVLLEPNEEGLGIIDFALHSDGSGREFLYQPAGGSVQPASHESVDSQGHFVHQVGKQVFKFAVTNMADVSVDVMERNGLTGDTVDWLVPHQANLRIIDATANRMELDPKKVMINIEKFGNTTSGTIPLCLWEWEKQLNKGDNLILSAFGGGFTWGAVYLKWAYDSKK